MTLGGAGIRPRFSIPVHPLTFKPEFIDAYELGSKNTLPDGGLTLDGDVFFYNYTGYQISEIVDRTSINLNFNATVIHAADVGRLGGDVPQRFLLAIAELRARVQ